MASNNSKKVCFVISPIGETDSETRKRSDLVLKHIICASVETMDYDVVRADKISEPGIITTQILQYIADSELVIADLTERNPNVFYELALRHATRKPLVQLIKKGEVIPFDVAATRIIQFDIHDLDSVDAAKLEILSQVKSLEAGSNDIHNPISVSFDLKMLKESGNAEERSLADIVEAISNLRVAVTSIEKRISPEFQFSSKVIEDFRLSLEELPLRIENRLDSDIRRRRRKLYPMMLDEAMHMGVKVKDPPLGFLMMISLLKDDFPWIYEIGLETYKGLKSRKSHAEKTRLVENFAKSFEMLRHPMMSEFFGRNEDDYFNVKELRHIILRHLQDYKF